MTRIDEYKKLWKETTPTLTVEDFWDALYMDATIREAIQKGEATASVSINRRYINVFESMCNQNGILWVRSNINQETNTITYTIKGWSDEVDY